MSKSHVSDEIAAAMAERLGLFKKAGMYYDQFLQELRDAKSQEELAGICQRWLKGRYRAFLEAEDKHVAAKQELAKRFPGCQGA